MQFNFISMLCQTVLWTSLRIQYIADVVKCRIWEKQKYFSKLSGDYFLDHRPLDFIVKLVMQAHYVFF